VQNAHENDELEAWRGQLDKVAAVVEELAKSEYIAEDSIRETQSWRRK